MSLCDPLAQASHQILVIILGPLHLSITMGIPYSVNLGAQITILIGRYLDAKQLVTTIIDMILQLNTVIGLRSPVTNATMVVRLGIFVVSLDSTVKMKP